MNKNVKVAKELIKLAKSLIAEKPVMEKIIKHFETFLKNELSTRWKVDSQHDSSYEGQITAETIYDGWEAENLFPDDFNENYEYCKESFCIDHSELFEGKSDKHSMEILNKSISNQDYDDEIWTEYEDYEDAWMNDDEGILFISIRFQTNNKSYNTYPQSCYIYATKSTMDGYNQETLYEDLVDFKDINENSIINQIESKIKNVIEELGF